MRLVRGAIDSKHSYHDIVIMFTALVLVNITHCACDFGRNGVASSRQQMFGRGDPVSTNYITKTRKTPVSSP